jgi:hypothetical protein
MDVAVEHGGYVTPALVPTVPAVELRKMVSRGREAVPTLAAAPRQ